MNVNDSLKSEFYHNHINCEHENIRWGQRKKFPAAIFLAVKLVCSGGRRLGLTTPERGWRKERFKYSFIISHTFN